MMNNMNDVLNNGSDVNAEGNPSTGPAQATNPAGEPETNGQGEVNYEEAYKNLEQKFGSQGDELGGYRDFVNNITPLLEKLDANPELVQAIVDGKIDKELAQAVTEGKVSIADASEVTEAAKQVEKEVGKKGITGMSPEDIEKLIESKVNQTRSEMEEEVNLKDFETKTQSFIESTDDFIKYADDIDEWLDTHNVSDIEIAYYAVKGQLSQREALKASEQAEAERSKEIALNASGGGSHATSTPDGRPLIDSLVGGPTNPLLK